ncbi:MAG: LptF/LptG family permease [Armatimonadetes bacterium]|nr:LptF/LptG family permease [Armatimonadota bacterium]
MRLLDRYLLKEVGGAFLFGLGVFTTLLMANHLFQFGRIVLIQGGTPALAVRLVLYKLPEALAYSLPMSILLGTLLALGRLSDRNEVAALRTGGISLVRIALPILAIGFLVSVATLALNEGVVPETERRFRKAFNEEFLKRPRITQEHVSFRDEVDGLESVFYVRRFRAEAGVMEGVLVNQLKDGSLRRVVEAQRARYAAGGWEMEDGMLYLVEPRGTVTTRFAHLRLNLRRTPEQIATPVKDPSEMTIRELRAALNMLRRSGQRVSRYILEINSKVAVPMAGFFFTLVAIPLGLRPHRSGTSIGLGLSIVVILAYYLLLSLTIALGQSDRLPPVVAAWLPNVVMGGLGAVLLGRASR